jgi:hypothetical protein
MIVVVEIASRTGTRAMPRKRPIPPLRMRFYELSSHPVAFQRNGQSPNIQHDCWSADGICRFARRTQMARWHGDVNIHYHHHECQCDDRGATRQDEPHVCRRRLGEAEVDPATLLRAWR